MKDLLDAIYHPTRHRNFRFTVATINVTARGCKTCFFIATGFPSSLHHRVFRDCRQIPPLCFSANSNLASVCLPITNPLNKPSVYLSQLIKIRDQDVTVEFCRSVF